MNSLKSEWSVVAIFRKVRCCLATSGKSRRRQKKLFSTESLESRQLLTAVPWENPSQLTSSIVPDGTDVVGQSSTFYQSFSYLGTPAALNRTIAEVFQAWTRSTNVNIGFVPDGGQPIGSAGKTQGDPRFGDVRIAAVSMSQEVYAFAVPHSGGIAGTWAGDIIVNSTFHPPTMRQFKSVLMHEVGHVFGLDHSTDPLSPMFLHNSPNNSLVPTAGDIANLQKLHGVRTDLLEQKKLNDTISNATPVRSSSFDGSAPLLNYGDISSPTDLDYYNINALSTYTGPVTVRLRVHGLSMFQGSLSITDRKGNVLTTGTAASFGQDVVLRLNVTAQQELYIRVNSAAPTGTFNVGRYALLVSFDRLNQATPQAIELVPAQNVAFLGQPEQTQLFLTGIAPQYFNDLHLNDTIGTATTLKTTPGFVEGTAYGFDGTITDNTDVDVYAIKSPRIVAVGDVMTVTLDVAEAATLIPSLTIFDSVGRVLPARMIRNGAGTLTLQVSGIANRSTVFLSVRKDPTATRHQTGNYSFRVRFGAFAEQSVDLVSGTLTASASRQFRTIEMTQTRLLALALTPVGAAAQSGNVATQVTLFDSTGHEIYRLVAIGASVRTSETFLLKPGTYIARINATTKDGAPLPASGFRLSASMLSDDTGPLGTNPTDVPPIDAGLIDVVVVSPPTPNPPPPVINQTPNENPWVYQPNPFIDFQDWYWYLGVL